MAEGDLPHRFQLPATDLKGIIDRTRFAISNEETRYYLNGIYFHSATSNGTQVLRGVATDGHRLARVEVPLPKGAADIPGVIVPRKTVGEVRKLLDESDGSVDIELSDTRIRFAIGNVTLVSKLIDGTFPDYERVIPTGNDKVLNVPCKEFAHAVDRVSTISTEKSRAIKLAVAKGVVTLSATSPDAGSATEEIEVEYKAAALEIGFNSRYLLDITEQITGAEAPLPDGRRRLADPGARRRRRAARSTCSCRCGYDGAADQRPRLLPRRRNRRCAGHPCRAPAPPDRFPQLPPAPPRLRSPSPSCWWAPTARARPISWRRCPSWRRAAACAGRAWTRSAAVRAAGSRTPRLGGRRHDRYAGRPARHRHRTGAGQERRRRGAPDGADRRPAGQSQTVLGLHVAAVWLTPQLDRLFLDGPGERRRFLDRLVTALHPQHAGDVAAYENALRQRARLLADGGRDPHWFTRARGHHGPPWRGPGRRARRYRPSPRCRGPPGRRPVPAGGPCHGGRDRRLDGRPCRRSTPRIGCAPNWPPAACVTPRPAPHPAGRIAAISRCAISISTCRQREGSTGQQKAVLVSIALAHARLVALARGRAPLLLLDEIAAHLDAERRAAANT